MRTPVTPFYDHPDYIRLRAVLADHTRTLAHADEPGPVSGRELRDLGERLDTFARGDDPFADERAPLTAEELANLTGGQVAPPVRAATDREAFTALGWRLASTGEGVDRDTRAGAFARVLGRWMREPAYDALTAEEFGIIRQWMAQGSERYRMQR